MSVELKPCPWCSGAPNSILVRHPVKGWQVECVCGVRGPGYSDTASAIAGWNTRDLEQREAVQGEAIEAEAKRLFKATTAGWSNVTAWEELHRSTRELYVAHALRRLATPPRDVPDGFVLVPRVPTEAMVVAGFESKPDPYFSGPETWKAYEAMTGCRQAAHRAKLCWEAMLAAAPSGEV